MPYLERVTGDDPASQPWEGRILPMYYTRKCLAALYHYGLGALLLDGVRP